MSKDYFKDRNIICDNRTAKLLENLPSFCEDYIISIETHTSALTRLNYIRDITLFFEFAVNNVRHVKGKKLDEISVDDISKFEAPHIERYLSYVSHYEADGKQYSNNDRAKARKLSSIKSLFKYLYNRDLIPSDVSAKVTAPKIKLKEIIRLDSDEVENVLTNAETEHPFISERQSKYNRNQKERDVAMLTLFLGTGIRVSELVGLNINDIDFETNSFVVTRKGGNRSILYFSDEVKETLSIWCEMRERILEDSDMKIDALFLSSQKKRISVRAVENIVKKYAKAITPLKKITPHKLRSTYGTSLYSATRDIYVVAEVLGHKDINTTKKHYADISNDIKRNAATAVKLKKDD